MKDLVLKNEKEIRVISVNSLFAVKVEDYICTFYIENENDFSCTKSLKEIKLSLPDHFIKINRNTIINFKKMKSINLKRREIFMFSGNSFIYSACNYRLIREYIHKYCNDFK
jgi:DNA-binding LytR/AlgR family response regulator